MREFDVIVLGLGGIGSGAAYWLARGGARVLGLEQFELGHLRGESHDRSRIIRLSYHTPQYVSLAKSAYAAWATLEGDTGERIVYKTGGLDLGPSNGAIPLDAYANSLDTCGVPFERLDAAAIRKRWPAFTIGDDVRGIYQQDGGIAAAAVATAAHQRAARAFGADLRDGVTVASVRDVAGEVEVVAGSERFRAGRLVIAAGPWSARVLTEFDLRLPLEVTKEQVTYIAPRDAAQFALGRFPVWIWLDDPSFYGFPIFGDAGVKIAQDAGGKAVDPDSRSFEPDADITARVRAFLSRVLPSALGRELVTKTCLYTLTPDRDFVIDTLPEHPHVSIAIGAGHAFKFASVIGRTLSELAIGGTTSADISGFEIDRPILRLEAPPKSYMV